MKKIRLPILKMKWMWKRITGLLPLVMQWGWPYLTGRRQTAMQNQEVNPKAWEVMIPVNGDPHLLITWMVLSGAGIP